MTSTIAILVLLASAAPVLIVGGFAVLGLFVEDYIDEVVGQ